MHRFNIKFLCRGFVASISLWAEHRVCQVTGGSVVVGGWGVGAEMGNSHSAEPGSSVKGQCRHTSAPPPPPV